MAFVGNFVLRRATGGGESWEHACDVPVAQTAPSLGSLGWEIMNLSGVPLWSFETADDTTKGVRGALGECRDGSGRPVLFHCRLQRCLKWDN